VADAKQRRTHAGCSECARATGGHDVRSVCSAETYLASTKCPDRKLESFVYGIKTKYAQQIDNAADPDVPEEIFRCLRAAASSFVNLRSGNGFRKRQFGIFHHAFSHQRNKEHAENAADGDQRSGLPVGIRETE